MSVDKKKDGRWYCAYRDPNRGGKVAYEYFGHGDEGRKDAVERDLQIKMEKNRRHEARPKDSIVSLTFDELVHAYIDARKVELSKKTIDGILLTAAVYTHPVIGSLPITRIAMAHWSEIEKKMIERELTARSINKYFQYMSGIFNWAVEREYLKESPWARRKPLRTKQKFRVELLTPEELQRIMDAADDHLRWALEVELNTGVRPGETELFALKWDDFDDETGALRVATSKTAAHNPVHTQYVSEEFLRRLKERRAEIRADDLRLAKRRGEIRPECPYVISFRGAPVRQLANAWKTAKKKAGIARQVRLYDIRHFFITHALAGGASILDLAHRVGHKNGNMIVNVYAHLVEEMQTKKPFSMPDFNFKKGGMHLPCHKMLAKNVSQGKTDVQGTQPNNLLQFKKNGRGGVI